MPSPWLQHMFPTASGPQWPTGRGSEQYHGENDQLWQDLKWTFREGKKRRLAARITSEDTSVLTCASTRRTRQYNSPSYLASIRLMGCMMVLNPKSTSQDSYFNDCDLPTLSSRISPN